MLNKSKNLISKLISSVKNSKNLQEQNKHDIKLSESQINNLMFRVQVKLSKILSQEDLEIIEELDKGDIHGKVISQYLSKKVPNLKEIFEEEIQRIKQNSEIV